MWGCSLLGWSHLFPLAERDSYMRESIHLFRLMIHTFVNDVFEDSDVFGACLCRAVCVCALGDKWWEQSVHLGGLQRHVFEYTTEPRCHLWLEATAHHPQGSGVVNFGLEGNPLRGPPAGAVCAADALSETGNEWEKEAETTLCCQTTGLMEVRAGSRRCSISHQGKKTERVLSFLSPKVSANCVHRAQCNFCHSTLRVEITHFLLVGQEKDRGGRGWV